MEYGPRALGNRSIICSAEDISINNILNAKLKRSEFMPLHHVFCKKILIIFLKQI